MALQTIPGQVGYIATKYSAFDGRAIGKFTDKNHLDTLQQMDSPTPYDRGIVDIYTQTSLYADDFMQMINQSDPWFVDSDTFSWEISDVYQFVKLVEVPETTLNNPTPGIDGQAFELVFDRNYFQLNDIITADKRYGDELTIVSDPLPYNAGFLYRVILTGVAGDMTAATSADFRWLTPGVEYDKVNHATGEFDQNLSGLDNMPARLKMFDSVAAGWGLEHTITKWADEKLLNERDAAGRIKDIVVYDQYRRNERGESVYTGSRWEPLVERMMREEMLKIRRERMIWGKGGESSSYGFKQESKKHVEGVYHKMRRNGNLIQYNQGDFNINMLRDAFGDLFYRRVPMNKRRVKLFTNEAGMRLFRQAAKEDLFNAGITILADERFVQGSGQNMTVNYGFEAVVTMETGRIEVSHLMELDLPQQNSEFGQNKYSTPIFLAFDVSNPDGGLQRNIREVRKKGTPSMTWGYVNGRQHHLGHFASKGHDAANKFPGYTIFMDDRSDVFIEDLSRTVMIEQVPQF